MERKNVSNILQNYLDAQQLNFIEHLQCQEQNFQAHLQRMHDIFSDNPNNDSNKIQQQLRTQKLILEDNIKLDNKKFKNNLEEQKRKTNILLARSNIFIPENNQNRRRQINNFQNNINRNNNNNNNSNDKKIIDKNLEFKKLKAISALPCFQYRYIMKYEKRPEKNCSICLNDFKLDDILIRFSCKEHIFHKNCIFTWLEKSDICPLCKKSLLFK